MPSLAGKPGWYSARMRSRGRTQLPLTVRAWRRAVRTTNNVSGAPAAYLREPSAEGQYMPRWQKLRPLLWDLPTQRAGLLQPDGNGWSAFGTLEPDAHQSTYPGCPGQHQPAREEFRPAEATGPQSPRHPDCGLDTQLHPCRYLRIGLQAAFGAQSRAAMAVPDWQSGTSMRATTTLPGRIGNSTTAR